MTFVTDLLEFDFFSSWINLDLTIGLPSIGNIMNNWPKSQKTKTPTKLFRINQNYGKFPALNQ